MRSDFYSIARFSALEAFVAFAMLAALSLPAVAEMPATDALASWNEGPAKQAIVDELEKLVAEEEQLYSKGNLSDEEIKKLHIVKIELDRYWDFLRQRKALRDAGESPDKAQMRSAKTVENYKQ